MTAWRVLPSLLAAAAMVALAAPAGATAKTVWLCNPSQRPDPCLTGLSTTLFSPTGQPLSVQQASAPANPPIDCFYVYPTVSEQPTPFSNLHVDPAERSIALYQAARFSQSCRVFAPMYRQKTFNASSGASRAVPFSDVRAAWRRYLKVYNHGRGVVLIGHSQGAVLLSMLISGGIDRNRKLRRKLVSAILLGGAVTVRPGSDVGGTFKHIPACRSARQLGCVVAYSTFDQPVPAVSKLGRATPPLNVLCTNPAALSGGTGALTPIFPTQAFAPRTHWATTLSMLGLALPTASTPWIELPGRYSAQCVSANSANVLQITPVAGAPTPTPAPDPSWGLHFVDVNLALGNLVALVKTEASAYLARHGG